MGLNQFWKRFLQGVRGNVRGKSLPLRFPRRWGYFLLALITAWACLVMEQPAVWGFFPSDSGSSGTPPLHPAQATLTLPPKPTTLGRSSLAFADVAATSLTGEIPDRLRQGQTLYQAGRFSEAIQVWESTIAPLQPDPPRQAIVFTLLSLAQKALGQWESAQTNLDRSATIWQTLGDSPAQHFIQGKYWNALGSLRLTQGQLPAAYDAYLAAEVAYGQAGDSWGQIQSRLNQVKLLQLQGLGLQAQRSITAWIPDLEALPDTALKVAAFRQLADSYGFVGDRTTARVYANQSLTLAQALNTPQEKVQTLLSLGHLSWNEPRPAFDWFTEALTEAVDFPALQIEAQVNLIRLIPKLPRSISQLADLYRGLQHNLEQFPLGRSRVFTQLNLTQTLLEFPAWQTTLGLTEQDLATTLNQALQDSQTLQDGVLQAYAWGLLGTLQESDEQWGEAQSATEKALLLSQQLNDFVGAYQWQWQLGRIFVATNELGLAESSYKQAIETLTGLRTDLASLSTDLSFSFREKIEPVYRQYVKLLLTPEPNQAIPQVNLSTARDTIEALQIEELVNFFRANCVASETIDIDRLDPTAAVIYPIVLPDSLEIILSLAGQPLAHYQSQVSKGNLENAARLIRSTLLERGGNQRWRTFDTTTSLESTNLGKNSPLRVASYLYNAIVAPLEADLQASGVTTLVFALDGVLRNIPMGILFDGDRYLIEKYAVAISPSLSLTQPKAIESPNLQVLIGGVTEGGELDVTGTSGQRSQIFSPLPFVKNEIYGIQQSLKSFLLLNDGQALALEQPNATPTAPEAENRSAGGAIGVPNPGLSPVTASTGLMLRPQGAFNQSSILDQLKTGAFPIVHFATHGQFTSQAEETFILAWQETLNLNELRELLQPLDQSQAHPIELLVLSACQTALGDDRAALGLAGVAVRSGARSTLATLWSVDDQATAQFMQQFYQNLVQQHLSRAQAVQKAQLSLLYNEQFMNPYFWAPFILVGSWL